MTVHTTTSPATVALPRPVPADFLFGVATAAYQIEGATHRDGRADSIWDAFSRVPGAVVGGESGERACEHYERYRDDVALMRDLGVQVYRFSTSWARVQPDGRTANAAGLDFYIELVGDTLKEEHSEDILFEFRSIHLAAQNIRSGQQVAFKVCKRCFHPGRSLRCPSLWSV